MCPFENSFGPYWRGNSTRSLRKLTHVDGPGAKFLGPNADICMRPFRGNTKLLAPIKVPCCLINIFVLIKCGFQSRITRPLGPNVCIVHVRNFMFRLAYISWFRNIPRNFAGNILHFTWKSFRFRVYSSSVGCDWNLLMLLNVYCRVNRPVRGSGCSFFHLIFSFRWA